MGNDGDEVMTQWLNVHGTTLCEAVAEFAVFCPVVKYDKMKSEDPAEEAYFRHNMNLIRRASQGETRRKLKDGIYLDDNSDINGKFKRLTGMSDCKHYVTCHIYPYSRDADVFSAVANVVLLPEIIAGLSDHCKIVMDLLKYRAYELYGWFPRKREEAPERPEVYDAIKWRSPEGWTPFLSRAVVDGLSGDLRARLTRWAGKKTLLVHEVIRIIHGAGDEIEHAKLKEKLSDIVTTPSVTISSLMCNSGNAYGEILQRVGDDRIAIKPEYRELIAKLWK